MSGYWWYSVTVVCFFKIILGATDASLHSPRTCIVGAGYAGLAAARYLKQNGVDFTVYEAQRDVGGNWNYLPIPEEDGLPPFAGGYKNLRTNTPRVTMEFANYPFPDAEAPSYPSGTCFLRYLKNFTKEFDLEKYIQFRTLVTSVKRVDKKWEIAYTKTDSKEKHTDVCDNVIIAVGHYHKPKVPRFEGQNDFRGTVIHSQRYKDPAAYANRRVMVVGAGASGLDLVTHLTNVSSTLIHSHHLTYNEPYFGKKYVKKPDIKMFTSNGVVFKDDSYEEVDDVILCTGYEFDLSILDKSCGLTVSRKFVLPLYQHMVNIRHPSMFLLGITKVSITRTMDAQADYAAAVITGKYKLPSQEDMLKHWLQHVYAMQTQGKKIIDVNLLGPSMDQYFGNLTREAGTTRVAPVLTTIRDYNKDYRLIDLLNYRDYEYQVLDDTHYKTWYNPKRESCDIK